MGLIFISHSSANNAEARAIEQWLRAEGWADIFLDFDPNDGIAPGARWQKKLKAATERCKVVLLLLSPDWVRSPWCQSEYLLANQLGKTIVGCVVQETPRSSLPQSLTAEWQIVDLTTPPRGYSREVADRDGTRTVTFSDDGLRRLRIGLKKSDIEAEHFHWPPQGDPDRSPYPGLSILTEEDAGIFFGREGAIVTALDRLRAMRSTGLSQMLVILGASGAGKSSFMRAGLIPRLERDERHFVALPAMRPGDAAIGGDKGLVSALEEAMRRAKLAVSRAEVRDSVAKGAAGVRTLFTQIFAATAAPADLGMDEGAPPPTFVLPIDQAEELLDADGAAEAAALLDILEAFFAADAKAAENATNPDNIRSRDVQLIVVATIRTDQYERLQVLPQVARIAPQTFGLAPMPIGSYGDVIRGPAKRLAESGRRLLTVDEQLVDELLIDVEQGGARDSLPLLSFTLQRLYREHRGSGALTLKAYESEGRIRGSIDAAIRLVMKIADGDSRIPREPNARLVLLRRGLIPWLAVADYDTGLPRRRVARQSEIPEEARPLIDILVEQRLLTRDIDRTTREVTLEPAHESLLRQWSMLDGWLKEDSGVFVSLQGLKRAARDWAASAKDPAYLIHTGLRLADAERAVARPDFANMVEPTELAYLAAARAKESKAEGEKFARLRRQRMLAVAAVGVFAAVAVVVGFFWSQANDARIRTEAALRVNETRTALQDGDVEEAIAAGLAGYETLPNAETRSILIEAAMELSPNLEFAYRFENSAPQALTWREDGTLAVIMREGTLRTTALEAKGTLDGPGIPFAPTAPPADGSQMLPIAAWPLAGGVMSVFRDGAMVFADADQTAHPVMVKGEPFVVRGGAAIDWNPSGATIAFATDMGVVARDCSPGPPFQCADRTLVAANAVAVAVSPDGAVAWTDGEVLTIHGQDRATIAHDFGDKVNSFETLEWLDGGLIAAKHVAGAVPNEYDALAVIDVSSVTLPKIVVFSTIVASTQWGVGSIVAWSPTNPEVAYLCGRREICITEADATNATFRDGIIPGIPYAARSLKPRSVLFGHEGAITGVAWSPDGDQLATISTDGWLRVWNRIEDRMVRRDIKADGFDHIESIASTADGSRIAAATAPRELWIGDPDDDAMQRLWFGALPEGWFEPSLSWSPSAKLAALYRYGIAIGNPAGAPVIADIGKNDLSRVAWVNDDVFATLPVETTGVGLYNANGTQLGVIQPDNQNDMPFGVVADPAGRMLYISYRGGAIRRWNVASNGPLETFVEAPPAGAPPGDRLGAGSLAVSPDGSLLAASRGDHEVILNSTADGSVKHRLRIDAPDSKAVAFSPDGARFAVLGSNGTLYVWDMTFPDPQRLFAVHAVAARTFSGSRSRVHGVAWMLGNRIAVGNDAGDIQLMALDEDGWKQRIRHVRRYMHE